MSNSCYKATFYFSAPPSLGWGWVNFDGIVARLLSMERLGDEFFNLATKPKKDEIYEANDLPFEYVDDIPKASIVFFGESFDEIYEKLKIFTYYKKFEMNDVEKFQKKRIYIGSGFYKNYVLKIPYVLVNKAYAYFQGDVKKIEKLLANLVGIGGKTRIGWGTVEDFEIEEIDEDRSFVFNGIAMRPIPARLVKKADEYVNIVCKPPYPLLQPEKAVAPFTRCEI